MVTAWKDGIYLQAFRKPADWPQAIILFLRLRYPQQCAFCCAFPGQVGLIHSGLSAASDMIPAQARQASSSGSGPRSALFTPFSNIGLIVIDECHDDSYYQSEASPHYHAREAAIVYARQLKATCLLGSATPDIISMYRSQQGLWQYLHLPNRILAHRKAVQEQLERLKTWSVPQEQTGSCYEHLETSRCYRIPGPLVDMRIELQAGTSIFSRPCRRLQIALEQNSKRFCF